MTALRLKEECRVPPGQPAGGQFAPCGGGAPSLHDLVGAGQTPPDAMRVGREAADRLTGLERESVREYTDFKAGFFSKVNSTMRSCPPEFECVQGWERYLWQNVETAIAKMPPLPKPYTIYRGIDVPPAVQKSILEKAELMRRDGVPFQFPSLTSTSFDQTVGWGGFATQGAGGQGGPVLYKIAAHQGLPLEPVSATPAQHELLLSAVAEYKVVSVEDNVITLEQHWRQHGTGY